MIVVQLHGHGMQEFILHWLAPPCNIAHTALQYFGLQLCSYLSVYVATTLFSAIFQCESKLALSSSSYKGCHDNYFNKGCHDNYFSRQSYMYTFDSLSKHMHAYQYVQQQMRQYSQHIQGHFSSPMTAMAVCTCHLKAQIQLLNHIATGLQFQSSPNLRQPTDETVQSTHTGVTLQFMQLRGLSSGQYAWLWIHEARLWRAEYALKGFYSYSGPTQIKYICWI